MVEIEINNKIKELLNSKNPQDLLENIYYKKFEDLEETINGYRKNGKIYNQSNNYIKVDNKLKEIETKKEIDEVFLENPAPVPLNK